MSKFKESALCVYFAASRELGALPYVLLPRSLEDLPQAVEFEKVEMELH